MIKLAKYFKQSDLTIPGIYFLLFRGKVVYIGKSINLISRIKCHSWRRIRFDSVRAIPCREIDLLKYEHRWIMRFRPKHNTRHVFRLVKVNGEKRKQPINLHHYPGSKENLKYLAALAEVQKSRLV